MIRPHDHRLIIGLLDVLTFNNRCTLDHSDELPGFSPCLALPKCFCARAWLKVDRAVFQEPDSSESQDPRDCLNARESRRSTFPVKRR